MAEQHPSIDRDIALAELEVARAERDTAQAQLQALLQSRTWRLGEPLRALLRLLRQGRWVYNPPGDIRIPVFTLATPRLAISEARAPAPELAPTVSIIVVSHDNLMLTAHCLDNVIRHTPSAGLQLIVIDNGSRDATPVYLATLRERLPALKVILNPHNHGLAAAINQGLRVANGQTLVLLDQQCVVQHDWLAPLARRLQDPAVGLVEAVIPARGDESTVLPLACVALSRAVFEQVGELNAHLEGRLAVAQDYRQRVQAAGREIDCVKQPGVEPQRPPQLPAHAEPQVPDALVAAALPTAAPAPRAGHPLRQLYYRLPLSPGARYRIGTLYRRLVKPAIRPVRQALASPPPITSLPHVAPRAPGKADYFVWGVIDWHFRHQRPQQLAKVLASQGHRVFYVSSQLLDRDHAGFDAQALDDSGHLIQVKLFARHAPVIYHEVPNPAQLLQLHQGLGQLLQWADCQACVSLVNHPFWTAVAQALPDHCMAYDCMDNHEGFGSQNAHLLAMEKALLASADLTLFTSTWLEQTWASEARRTCVVRNAADYAHFAQAPAQRYQDAHGRRIIGYYGAIAEWFDVTVVAAIAEHFSDCCILLVGDDTVHAATQLRHHTNVVFTGEVPYTQLPYYLYAFDVCLLPFKVIPLTLATNPVKVYEYLSAGKPVVCTDLPEMQQFAGHISTAREVTDYLAAINALLADGCTPSAVAARQAFARQQTWDHRARVLVDAVQATTQQAAVSVIVVTYNNLALTRQCLASLAEDEAVLEVIVVDNASSDATPDYLRQWASQGTGRRLVLNADNRGFSAANNQGLALAQGDYLMLLNNDTQVMPGTVRTLLNHVRRDPEIGLIGPVTDNIGNEAKVDLPPGTDADLRARAAHYTRAHCGQVFEIRNLAFFAVMMPRSTYTALGPLDEAFGLGFFEDDDYCRRAEQAGLKRVCAEDAFVHHHLSASFDAMKASARQALFDRNKQLYEAKWGQWQPHTYRS